MFFYFSAVNIYFRILVIWINTNYLWHWRITLQGILNDLIASGLFYLFFKILWVFLKSNSIRSYLLGVFIFFWILINYANYQYNANFDSLLPLSWFVELRNIFKMVGVLDFAVSIFDMDLVYLIVIPLVFSIATIWKFWESFNWNPAFLVFSVFEKFQLKSNFCRFFDFPQELSKLIFGRRKFF